MRIQNLIKEESKTLITSEAALLKKKPKSVSMIRLK